MSSIFSAPLGLVNPADTGVVHTLYTVPLLGGPAVVKSVSIGMVGGPAVIVFAVDTTPTSAWIAVVDNQGVATRKGQTILCAQPLLPGWMIQAINYGAAGSWTALCGGYQFTS